MYIIQNCVWRLETRSEDNLCYFDNSRKDTCDLSNLNFIKEQIFLFVKEMIKFIVSAPGRMFLCGEDVIMCGKHAVVTSLNLRTTLKFVELDNDPKNIIKIEFPDVNLSLNLPLEYILSYFCNDDFLPLFENNILLLKQVQYFITINGLWTTYKQRYSLQTFLFLFLSIAYGEKLEIKSFHVHLTTQLPISAGFGSSTSFAVCLAACFLHWSRLQKGTHNNFNDEELKQIMSYVMICEEDARNYWSFDPNVCTYGQVLKAQFENPIDCNLQLLQVPQMEIVFIDTKIEYNIYEPIMIQRTQMKHYNPDQSELILRTVDEISESICNTLVAINNSQNNNNLQQLYDSYTSLGTFISSSQNTFRESGLSHSTLDKMFSYARKLGFAGRLTGFYGYAYILVTSNASEENINNLVIHLIITEGFTVKFTSVNCDGVKLYGL